MGHYGIPMKHGYGILHDIMRSVFLWEYIWQNNASRNTSYMG